MSKDTESMSLYIGVNCDQSASFWQSLTLCFARIGYHAHNISIASTTEVSETQLRRTWGEMLTWVEGVPAFFPSHMYIRHSMILILIYAQPGYNDFPVYSGIFHACNLIQMSNFYVYVRLVFITFLLIITLIWEPQSLSGKTLPSCNTKAIFLPFYQLFAFQLSIALGLLEGQ